MDTNTVFKILVVDDTPELLDITVRTLKKAGYAVFSAINGFECMQELHHVKPDIILLDVMLPDANGKDLAKIIKGDPNFSSVFIILLSSLKTSPENIAEGLEDGADGYIVRPVEKRELLARVSAACRLINAERKIKIQNEELIKLNAEKDKFFSIIAHDLKSPFNGFLGLTQVITEDLPNLTMAQVQRLAVTMNKSATNLYSLLNNLLEWAQIQQGAIPFNTEVIQLRITVAESMAMIHESAKNKEIEIATDIADGLEVLADKNMLQAVIRNLVSNAVKFTRKEGKVIISAKATDDKTIEIAIRDTGIGMNREMIDNLFRIDVKTNRKGTESEPSTGLGLLLCKEFVEKHDGKIWVESEVGVGSTFYFTLLCIAEPKEKVIVKNGVQAIETGNMVKNLKILIAEDDETSGELISIGVGKFAGEIINVRTGTEAVETCLNNPDIDLVLMDIQMPEMDGYEATRQIRQFNTEVIIIALTAFALAGDREKAMEAGCTDYISKPFKKDELYEIIQKHLRNRVKN